MSFQVDTVAASTDMLVDLSEVSKLFSHIWVCKYLGFEDQENYSTLLSSTKIAIDNP